MTDRDKNKLLKLLPVVVVLVIFVIYSVAWLVTVPIREKEERARIELVKQKTGIDETGFGHLPLILGRRESCVDCHDNIKGMEESHSPGKIGCYSCHLGNRLADKKEEAHKGFVLVPGNFADVNKTCGTIECHPQMTLRMHNNIMNTMNGVAAVDKWVFNEASSPDIKIHIDSIKFSPADTHLRNLCASCHLSNPKTEPAELSELSRGGGCIACHLTYNDESRKSLDDYKNKKLTSSHPNISIKMDNMACFGCHSRSGRISLSYDGWHETQLAHEELRSKSSSNYRILDDERVLVKVKADVHSEKGMLCVDCHNSWEVMGDGTYYLHKEDQLKVECTDCHYTDKPVTKKYSSFYEEEKKIASLLDFLDYNRNYLASSKTGIPLINTFTIEENPGKISAYLIKKSNKEKLPIRKPLFECTAPAHKNLSCSSCHNSWSPQCIGCHTQYDKTSTMYDLLSNTEREGEWIETGKDYLAEPSVLGIKEVKENGVLKKIVQEFVPGMVLKIIDPGKKEINKRLFAPAFSHTIRKEVRSCQSCHNNPLALGYGRGKLVYTIVNGKGTWKFTPKYNLMKDGLPEDAWIGFLKERGAESTTRTNLRSFSIVEQKRILNVGACLTCHKEDSSVIKNALIDFRGTVLKRKKSCIIPYSI